MEFRKFGKEDRSTFPYWFEHWKAFNYTAIKLGVWRPRFLFHDIKKPWQMLVLKDYVKVQKLHRSKSRHHIEYLDDLNKYMMDFDVLSMIIDNECSRLTKVSSPMTAIEYIEHEIKELEEERVKEGALKDQIDEYYDDLENGRIPKTHREIEIWCRRLIIYHKALSMAKDIGLEK